MDSNTKIIILVLILVFIKFFISNIDYFANTAPQQFKLYNPTYKVYLYTYDNKNLSFTTDKNKASLFYVDSEKNLKIEKYFIYEYLDGKSYIKLDTKKQNRYTLKFDDKFIYNGETNSKYFLIFGSDFGKNISVALRVPNYSDILFRPRESNAVLFQKITN